ERPAFTRVKGESAAPSSSSAGLRVYFGTIPDYSEEGAGLKLTGVSPGSPAEKAGLEAGDRIVKLGEKEIRNIYDYTYALGDHRPGDKVTVVVERNENGVRVRKSLEAVLGARASSAK